MKIFQILGLAILLGIIQPSCTKDPSLTNPAHKLPSDFQSFYQIFGDQGIGAGAWLSKDVVLLFDKIGSSYAWIENGVVRDKRPIKDEKSVLKGLPASVVSAAVVSKTKLYLFTSSGASYSTVAFDQDEVQGKWDDPSFFRVSNLNFLLRQWGEDDSAPFRSISAAYGWHPNRHCSIAVAPGERVFHLDKDKPLITTYDSKKVDFTNTVRLSDHSLYDCSTKEKGTLGLRTVVNAAFIYPVNGKVYEVFFFNNGNDFVFSEIGLNTTSEIHNIQM